MYIKIIIEFMKEFQNLIIASVAALVYIFKKLIDNYFYKKNYLHKVIIDKQIDAISILLKVSTDLIRYGSECTGFIRQGRMNKSEYLESNKNLLETLRNISCLMCEHGMILSADITHEINTNIKECTEHTMVNSPELKINAIRINTILIEEIKKLG